MFRRRRLSFGRIQPLSLACVRIAGAALEAARRNILSRFAFPMPSGITAQASTLSQGYRQLRASAGRAAEDLSKKLFPQNWRVAKRILKQRRQPNQLLHLISNYGSSR